MLGKSQQKGGTGAENVEGKWGIELKWVNWQGGTTALHPLRI